MTMPLAILDYAQSSAVYPKAITKSVCLHKPFENFLGCVKMHTLCRWIR